jgi:hypothetical protein
MAFFNLGLTQVLHCPLKFQRGRTHTGLQCTQATGGMGIANGIATVPLAASAGFEADDAVFVVSDITRHRLDVMRACDAAGHGAVAGQHLCRVASVWAQRAVDNVELQTVGDWGPTASDGVKSAVARLHAGGITNLLKAGGLDADPTMLLPGTIASVDLRLTAKKSDSGRMAVTGASVAQWSDVTTPSDFRGTAGALRLQSASTGAESLIGGSYREHGLLVCPVSP